VFITGVVITGDGSMIAVGFRNGFGIPLHIGPVCCLRV
jgi:hypothetical protein